MAKIPVIIIACIFAMLSAYARPSPTPTPKATGPYKGNPGTIPGSIYASNYDMGGQGVGYNDTAGANPGVYRTDGVDIKASSDTSGPGSGYVLGWRTTGEWTNYTVNAQAGQYIVTVRFESAFATGQFHLMVDGVTVIPSVTVPQTGAWDTASSWQTLSLGTVTFTSGSHVIKVYVNSPWFDLNYLTFTPTPKTTRTVYINATGTLGGNGSGSSATNPVDCSTQAKYDAFRQNVCPQGSDTPSTSLTIMYAPGTYKTNGSDFRLWWMCSNSGNIHQGAGINNTTLQLVNANSINTSTIFGSGGGAHQTHNFGVYDMTLDCNPAGNPKTGDCYESTTGDAPVGFPTGFITTVDRGTWSGAITYSVNDKVAGSNGELYICFAANTGVDPATESPHLKWGKDARGQIGCINLGSAVNVTIQRVKMIGFGVFRQGIECFVCNIGGISQASFQSVSNVLLDSCVFTNPASGNKDGCTVSDIINSVNLTCDSNCVTSNCQFINCWSPVPGKSGDFAYQHCVASPKVTGCTATNCDIFFYAELGFNEWPGQTIQINNNTCTGVRSGFSILADNETNAVTTGLLSFPNAVVSNNVFCQDDSTGGEANIFFVQYAGGNVHGQIGDITITGNTFKSSITNPAWLGARVAVAESSASLLQVANITANNNAFINYLPADHYIFDSGVLSSSVGANDISH